MEKIYIVRTCQEGYKVFEHEKSYNDYLVQLKERNPRLVTSGQKSDIYIKIIDREVFNTFMLN